MAEVNLSLKFAVTGSDAVETAITNLEKLKEHTKFKIELDIKDFNANLTTLKENLGKLGMNKTFQSSIEALKKTFEGFNTDKLDSGKIKAFIGDLTAVNTADIKEIVKQLNSLAPALAQLNSAKVPNLNSFMNGLKKLEAGNFNVDKIKDVIKTINSFQAINLQILGTKDLQTLLRVLKQMGENGIDDKAVKKLKQVLNILNGLKIDINMSGLSSIPSMIKNMEGLDKISINESDFLKKMQTVQRGLSILSNSTVDSGKSKAIGDMLKGFSGLKGLEALENIKLDEKKFLRKMQTIRKGLEELSQAKIDIAKIKSMADLISSLNSFGGSGGASGGLGGMGGIAGLASTYFSFNALRDSTEEAKQLEYAMLQVGVAGELSSQQMKELKQTMYELSSQSGKSALEITQAMDAIIKTGQSLEGAKAILDTALKTSVAAGEPLLATAESLSKILLAMNINANESMDITNMMMSVMNKTPASMTSMQEGLKQSIAGLANYASSTMRTGVALDDYKKKLVQTGLAMQGSQAMLGRQGEQSGRLCA